MDGSTPSPLRQAGLAVPLLLFLSLLGVPSGCSGPREGGIGLLRGRTELIAEAEERPPPPLQGPC